MPPVYRETPFPYFHTSALPVCGPTRTKDRIEEMDYAELALANIIEANCTTISNKKSSFLVLGMKKNAP